MKAARTDIQLLQVRNLTLKLGQEASPSVINLLCSTIWGTPGGMQYQHFNTAEKIQDLNCPWFLCLEKDQEAIGVLCLDQRKLGEINGFYIRYFSFAEGLRRKDTKEAHGEVPASKGQGLFKRFSNSFFEKPAALLEAAKVEKAIFYAYVELANARSRDMVEQMGLTQCGQFSTFLFSRIFTRRHGAVRRYRPEEREKLRAMVTEAYHDHAFFNAHGLFYRDNFFVVEADGKIVAGLQAQRVHWKIVDIPGLSGKAMMQGLPWIPLINRIFNPQKFHFAAIEGIFCLPGYESLIEPLLEGTLSELGLHTAILWLSTGSPFSQVVKQNVRWGLLQRMKKDLPATIVMRSYGYGQDELAPILARPFYISAFDST